MEHDAASTGNHPGIIDYKGNSYVFGFDYELNFALTPIHHERRAVTVAKFAYNPDGTIPNLGWWNRTAAPQIGTLDPYRPVERRRSPGHRGSSATATGLSIGRPA